MLESWPIVLLIGTVLGFLAGIGVGGGSLLVLWLTLVLGMEHPQARLINLLFFLPSAVVASFFRWRQGTLQIRKILPAIICGCIAAGICSYLSRSIDIALLRKLFGCLLLITGVRELLYKPRAPKQHDS